MATTEADVPEPVCETIREEEETKLVDQAANKVTKEEETSTDNIPNEPPETLESNFDVKDVKKNSEGSASTIESENFLRSPLIAEVSFEDKNLSDACKFTEMSEKITKDDTDNSTPGNAKLDDQPLEITGSEETILEGIKEKAEESNGKYGEKNMASVPSTVDSAVSTSGTSAGDIIYGLDQEDITVQIQMPKDTSTEDAGTTNSFTKEMGSPEENLCETILQSRESKGSEIPNVSEVKNLNPEVTMPNDESGRVKTTKDEIPCILVTDMPTEGESSSDQNETVNENSEKNAEEMADSFLKCKTTDETSSENAVKEEMSYDGNKTMGLPILIETANEEIKERKNGDNAKNLSCSPLVTTQIEEISSEQVGLGNELHNIAEKASQEKTLDRQTMTAVISHEYELQGENESESSFLKEKDDIHIQKCDKTVTTPEYSETIMEIAGKKSQEEIENQSKALEENITIHTNPTGTEETEENALIQDVGSQMKHEVHLEKEDEKPCFIDASMRDTSDDESAPKIEDEELRKAELSENKKDMESISVVKEATMQKYAESLEVAPEEVESSISIQNTETTSSLEEKSRSANPQEILCDEVEQTFEAVDRTEETPKNILTPVSNEETEENSTIAKGDEQLEKENKTPCITETLAMDISDNESTVEGKMKDADLKKDEMIKNQSGKESALLKQEATMEKPIDSLQVAHEDIKASTSDDDAKPSSLENQILSENPQEILGDRTESKSCGVVDTKEETLEIQAVPTIESNDDNEDNSVIKENDSEGKYEECLDKECEKPPVKEASIRDAIDDKSTYMEEDKFEDKDLRKAEQIENQTDIENTPLKEEATVMKPIESLQLDPEDIRTYASDHGTETTSLTASSQGNLDGITEDIAIENVTTVVSNEDTEEKSMIEVDGSQIKQEEYLEREGQIPFTKEVSTGKTSDDESIINHVDNTEHGDLRKAELLETEKNTESTLLKEETQMAIPIKSLQVVAEDIIASDSCPDTETSSQQERKLNAQENLGQQIEDETINAADTKEKTPEAQSVTTIFSNENSQENFLIQMDGSNIKHEELPEKEGEMLSLSETLVVESNNKESKVFHEDKDAESTLLKGGLQVDKPIESLKVGFEDIEASVSCQDREATSSLMDQSMTANPNEIIGEQKEEKISDDTKEKTPEAQKNFTTIVSNENAEKNSLIQVGASQKKHEELFENERKIPASSDTLTVEANNQESTVIKEDKIADEDLLKVDVYQQEESTFLKEEAQLDKPIESLQAVPGESKASTLCQDTETTSFLEKRNLTENPQEFEGDQAEDKIIDAADMKEKTSETHNFATTMTNENTEENSQQQMDGSQTKHEPFLSETSEVKTNDEESKIINEDKNAEITLLKEEVQVGQPIESLQVAREAIEASVSCQDPETSSLRERSRTENPQEVVGGQTEDKIIGTADIKDKTPEAQNFTPIFSNDNAENNSLIEVDASQRKREELFEKEREIPALSETLMAETNIKESIIIHEEKTEDENIKKVAESESEKLIESTFLNEEAQVDMPIESWSIAPEDGKASASCQETETSFLKERSQTTNSQEIEGNQTEHKIIDAANTKERLPEDFATILTNENSEENSLLQMDRSQMKHEELLEKEREIPSLSETSVVATSNQESIIIHEKKYEDEDLKKNMFGSEKQAECTLSKEEAHIGKPIESLQVAPEDNKASCQHIETTSSLVEQSLIGNTQFGDQTETQVCVGLDTKEKTPEAQGLATVVSNEKTEENSLEKEREIPSFSEDLIVETNNEEQTVMHEDKIEDKDLEKIDQFESKKHAESTLLKEEVQMDQPTKSLQAALKEIEASVSCQDPETNSLAEQGITANPQEIMGDHQTEEKIIDTADTKEKTLEVQISTKIVSNENAEMNSLIQVGASQKEHEDLFKNEREIPALSEASMVETNNQKSTVIQEDKIEDEDSQKIDVYQQEESVLSKEEAQLDQPIESFQAPPGDSKASDSGKDTETKGFLEEQSLTENPQEIKGDQKEDKLIDAADTKEKTSEMHNFATAVTNENITENSLLQMDCSKIKHKDLLNKEKVPSLSETLAVKTDNEESKIIHKDKDAGSTLLKEEVQVDQPIESLQVALKEIEESVPCQDPETTNSLAEQSITANPQEIMGDQTEDKKIETANTKEKTLEVQISQTVVSNENSGKNSLVHVDASLKNHEDLFVNEREIPALSDVSTVETNNQESTVIQNYKFEDEELQKVHVYKQDKSKLLKEEAQLDKPIESLQAAPGDSKASASCQDTETSFLDEQSLTENPQEIEVDQTEDKIIDAAGTREKTSETHLQNFATIVTNENIEENSLLQMDGSKIKHEVLLNKESEIPSLSEILTVKNNEEESKIIHEEKDAGSTLLKEEVQVNQPIESFQVALQEIEASLSCQDPEATNSLEERSITANPQEIMDDQTEDKIIDTADTKEKTLEAQNSTTIVSNEIAEKNLLIQVDASHKKHEDLFEIEREIPALSEASTVETNNQESTVTQEDKVDDKDLQKGDVYEHEESTLLKEESQLDKPIESLQAPPGDSKASASWQDTETTSFLEERSTTENPQEFEGEQTEDKTIDADNTKGKTSETHLQNFATTVTNENIEENSLLQMNGSKIKHEELLNEESEIPSLSQTLAVKTIDKESKIIPDDKDAGCTLLKEEVQVDQPIESLQVALKEIEASVPYQDPETTCSLAVTRLTENTQEIVGGQTKDKIINTADIKEKTPEAHNSTTIVSNEDDEKNSLIQVDASQKKHEDLFKNEREIPALSKASTGETNNEESIIIHEDKIEDQDVTKVNECESEKQVESTFLHDEAQADKPIKSLNVAPEDSKVSPSHQDTETSSFLEERSLTENQQEIAGDQIEEKTIDAAANTEENTPYTHDCATIVTNGKTDDDSLLQMDGSQQKHEELLEKEREIPSSTESLVEANNVESTIVHNDKFEDEDLKTVDMFEEKHAICSSSVEESHVDEPIESLQVASEDINASCQHLETTSSPKEKSLTAYPQFGKQTEDKIYDTSDTKEKTYEAQGFTTVVSNENIEENEQMPVDGSQIIHEILETKREIPSLSETLTVKTNNEETSSIHEDKLEDEDLKNDDKFESEKYAESNLLKDEAWVHQSIESLQVAPEYIKAPAPCQNTETRSFLEDQSPIANPKEIEGDQAEAEIIDAVDTKEKTQEAQDLTTITSNENAENNSLIQLGASQKKHEEQTESETSTLSDTLMVESYNEKSTIIHADNIEDEDLKKNDGHKNAEAQVDIPIESLQLAHEDIKASPSCHDTEITSSLEERSLTANPQEIVCDQTEDRIIDAADTKEESPEAQDFATNVANDETEDNSLLEMDGSQLKHEELLEKEREISSSSETLVQEANNEESTILHKDKSEDEDPRTVDTIENEKYIESTLLKEETKVGKNVESLQIAPEDIKASASCQERDTTSTLMEQSLTANAQETVSEQIEDKIIATADTKDKTPDALKKVTKIISNEENESVIPCCKSTDLDVITQLKEEELNDDLLKDVNYTHSVNAATTQSESTLQEHVPAADVLDADQLLPRGEVLDKPEEDCTIDLEAKLQDRAAGSNVEEINQTNDEASITELPNSAMTNDASKVSMIEEVSSDVCTDKGGKERNSVENPEDQDGSVAPHGENDDQSKEEKIEANDIISGQIIGIKVLADNDETQDSTIEKQMTENQHIAAQSEAVADEMINAFQEAPGEIQNIDSKAKTIETIEEEDYQKDFQMISAVDPAAQDGKESDSKSSHSPETKSSGVDIETVVDIADDANCEKLRPSISEMLKKDAGVTSLASEASETNSDHKIVEEANECHQKTDIQEIGVSDTGSITVSINENQMEACSEESTEVQVPQGETKVEEMQQDPVVRSEQKDIEGHPKNVSHIVSETTGVRADNNSFEESSRQSLQEIGNKEPQEKYQGLENLAHVKDSSMEKTQKDVQLCVAITNDSSIIQEMQVPEEDYIPSPDENILDKMDHKESEAAEDATNYKHTKNLHHEDTTESIVDDQKHLEPTKRDNKEAKCNVTLDQTMENTRESTLEVKDHSTIERDLTTDREETHSGRTTKDGDEAAKIEKDNEEEEEKGKENISDFSSKASITIEAKDEEVSRLVYEAADENFTSGVAEESNILNGMTETADSKVMKREETQKDTLDSVKSIEGLEIMSHDEDPEIQMTASKVIEVQEVGNLSASETSVLVSQSERANFDDAQIGSVTEEKTESNEVDFAHRESTAVCEFNDQGVNELKSREITTIENNAEKNGKEINRDDGTGYKTQSESVEEETQDDISYVPEKQELQGSVLLSKELPFKTYSKMEKITYDGEANEESVELGEEEKLKDVVNLNYNARKKEDNGTVNSISESSETVEPENMEVVTETVAQVQNCELISKVEDPITKEDKLEEAAAVVKSDKIVAADTLSRKETMKVYISTDEVKEETEGAKNYQEDEERPEEDSRTNTEELFEAIQNASENKKVPKVLGEGDATESINEQIVLDDKVVEEPNENIQANESKDGSLQQQENEKNVDQVTTGLDTKEKEHELDHQIEKTSIEDPNEEVNSSILVFQEEEYNGTGANGTNNVMTKDAELVTMNNKNTNTTIIELQEDHESKQGSLLLSEALQVQESEKQDKNDEIFSSDKAQGKDEEKVTISASKSDVEADKVDNLSRLTEDENNKNKIEDEKLDFSSYTKDASEISQNDHNLNEIVEAKVSHGGKDADMIQQDVVSNTVKQEIQEQQLANTVETVLEEKGINSEEDEIKDDSCNDLQENSSSVDTDIIAPSNILQGSIGKEAQGVKSQETAMQCSSLPILPHVKCSDMEIAQKDITLHLAKQDEDDLKELEASPLPTTDNKPLVLEADHTDNANTNSPIGSNIPMLQHGDSSGSSPTKGEKQEPSKFEKEEEKFGHEETTKPIKTEQSTEIDKHSISYLLQLSGKETLQSADHFVVKTTIQKEDLQEEKSDEAAHEEAKTDEEKDDEEELSEHKSSDMSSDAPVIVDAGDTDVKVAHKKSHNILSGVGSKVKHSIAKVKKAITGKSSHPKSHSPKYGEKI